MKVQGWMIKLGSFVVTVVLLIMLECWFVAVHYKFIFLPLAFLAILFIGEFLVYTKRDASTNRINLGWGLVYGSLTALLLTVAMIIYVSSLYA